MAVERSEKVPAGYRARGNRSVQEHSVGLLQQRSGAEVGLSPYGRPALARADPLRLVVTRRAVPLAWRRRYGGRHAERLPGVVESAAPILQRCRGPSFMPR